MAEADATLLRALTLGLKIDDLQKAARHDGPRARRPGPARSRGRRSPPTSLRDRLREAVATLQPLKPRCTNTDDDAYQQIVRLEAFLARADRADGLALERLLPRAVRRRPQGPAGQLEAQGSLQGREGRAQGPEGRPGQPTCTASNADLAWAPARPPPRLPRRLRGAEARTRRRRLRRPPPEGARRPDPTRSRSAATSRGASTSSWSTSSRTPTRCRPRSPSSWPRTRKPSPPAGLARRPPRPGKLFVVGDPKQSIYRFRRADIAIYEEVKRLIEANGGEVLPLTANFRTVPSVLAFVNERFDQVFSEPDDPEPRPLDAYRDRGREGRRPHHRPAPAQGPPARARRPQGRHHPARPRRAPSPASSTTSPATGPGASATAATTPSAPRAPATSACSCAR